MFDFQLSYAKTMYADECVQIPHQGIHDLEAAFWVLILALARANPLDADIDIPHNWYSEFCASMLQHNIDGPDHARILWKQGRPADLETILHPKLHTLVPMLCTIGKYLSIDWTCYDVKNFGLDEFHGYHFIKAALLQQIQALEGADIQLNTKYPRVAYLSANVPSNYRQQHTSVDIRTSEKVVGGFMTEDARKLVNDELYPVNPDGYLEETPPKNWKPRRFKNAEHRRTVYTEIRNFIKQRYPTLFEDMHDPEVPKTLQGEQIARIERIKRYQRLRFLDEAWFRLEERPYGGNKRNLPRSSASNPSDQTPESGSSAKRVKHESS
jgi:hypothetical protein